MSKLTFSWDNSKNSLNIKKHGISFEEAQSVFIDENARIIFDPDHSDKEDRFIILGLSFTLNLLVVSHCYLEHNNAIRIISARKANKSEAKQYMEFII